jgi:putative transposase
VSKKKNIRESELPDKDKKLFKAVNHSHGANDGKLEVIHQTIDAYQETAVDIANRQWRFFFESRLGHFDKNLVIGTPKKQTHQNKKTQLAELIYSLVALKSDGDNQDVQQPTISTKQKQQKPVVKVAPVTSELSERFKQTIQYQVVGQLDSYLSNLEPRFIQVVNKSSIKDETTRIQLFYLNKYHLWFQESVTMKGVLILKDVLKLARNIFHHVSQNKPRMNNINPVLDQKVAQLEKSGVDGFGWWIHLSNINEGKPIDVPINSNKYFNEHYGVGHGVIKHSIQVNRDKTTRKIRFGIISEIDPQFIETIMDVLGIDIGVKSIIATSCGDTCGDRLYFYLKKYDRITTKLLTNLQANEIDVATNKRYNDLNKKVREFMKNEVNRILNRLVEKYAPKVISLENLDFQRSNMDKEMNRLIGKFGLGHITKKVEQLKSDKGIQIEYQNPAYTSQECSCCGYVDKKNRKTRDIFECLFCGTRLHADVNAARVMIGRRSSPITCYWKKEKVLEWLNERFKLRHSAHPEHRQRKLSVNSTRRHSSAKDGVFVTSVSKDSQIGLCA